MTSSVAGVVGAPREVFALPGTPAAMWFASRGGGPYRPEWIPECAGSFEERCREAVRGRETVVHRRVG